MLVLTSVLVETHPADIATLLSRFVAIADLARQSIELHARLLSSLRDDSARSSEANRM